MKRVLVIAYYFPPLGMGGVRRVVNLCKYLPDFGWEPVVLTVKPIKYFAQDEDFMKDIRCKVYRSESLDPLRLMKIGRMGKDFPALRERYHGLSNFLFIPDNKIGWLPFGLNTGAKIIKQDAISLIFATAPPYTGLIIGYLLNKMSKLPLVIEFRDPWPYSPYSTMFHRWVGEFFKKTVLNESDSIITINEPIRLNLMQSCRHGFNRAKTVVVIPPGYSPDDFWSTHQHLNAKPARGTHKFTITYIGSFIPPRTPMYFLKALSNLLTYNKINVNDIWVEIIGFCGEQGKSLVRELGLAQVVNFESYRPHKYCIERMLASDLLWIMIDETEKTASTGKIGEYVGANKPILATVPEGPCADIIREAKLGEVVPPRDVIAIGNAIYEFYLKFKRNEMLVPELQKVEEYNFVNLTKRLAYIFDSLQKK